MEGSTYHMITSANHYNLEPLPLAKYLLDQTTDEDASLSVLLIERLVQ